MITFQHQCEYCDKKYKQEKAFLNHECKEMLRSEEIKAISGRRAFDYFLEWHKIRNYCLPDERAFVSSTYYNAFINLEKFARNTHLPSVKKYMELMVKNGLQPQMWTNALAYKHYTEYVDRRSPPITQAAITTNIICDICDKYGVDTSDFFEVVVPNEIIQCFTRRQLSPWVLYNSVKFLDYYFDEFSDAQRSLLDNMYPMDKWEKKFNDNKAKVKEIKKFVNELGL